MSENKEVRFLFIGFIIFIIVSLTLSFIINDVEINKTLFSIFVIITTCLSFIKTENGLYMAFLIFFGGIACFFFFFRMAILTPPLEYLEPEIVCGVYDSTESRISRSGGGVDHSININNKSFIFQDKQPFINLDGFERGQKLCLELQRRKDKHEELNLAQLIAVKRI